MNIINKYLNEAINNVISKGNEAVNDLDISQNTANISSVTSINAFRNKLQTKNGVARTNQFMVSFSLPSWMSDSTLLSYLGITQFNEELGLLCNKAIPPTKTIQSQSIKYNNTIERKIPSGYKWDEVTFSFIERNDYFIFKLFNEWLDGINNPITNTGRFYNDICSDVKINFLDKTNKVIAYYSLFEAYPTSITISNYDWEQLNQYVSIDVTFNYIYATHRDYELTSLVESVQNFGSSDVMNTLGDLTNINWSNIWSKLTNLNFK